MARCRGVADGAQSGEHERRYPGRRDIERWPADAHLVGVTSAEELKKTRNKGAKANTNRAPHGQTEEETHSNAIVSGSCVDGPMRRRRDGNPQNGRPMQRV